MYLLPTKKLVDECAGTSDIYLSLAKDLITDHLGPSVPFFIGYASVKAPPMGVSMGAMYSKGIVRVVDDKAHYTSFPYIGIEPVLFWSLVRAGNVETFASVVLHEIAHGLDNRTWVKCDENGFALDWARPRNPHDAIWKRIARAIGGHPEATIDPTPLLRAACYVGNPYLFWSHYDIFGKCPDNYNVDFLAKQVLEESSVTCESS